MATAATERTDGLTFSRLMTVHTRAQADDGQLLTLAKKRATDPAIFDEFPPFFFPAEISSSRWDAYDTRMGASTLKNFADDATAGVAFLRNHNTRDDAVGASLAGVFTGAQGNGVARTTADFYLLSDPATLPYIAKIRSGVVRDVSVGFYGGQWMCSICNKDMQEWFSRDGCPHFLGMTYTPKDEAGKQVGDPVVARATIEDARLAEVSGVYDGATPGAMIAKARAMATEGLLVGQARELIQVRYRIHLPEHSRAHPGATLGATEEERHMPPEDTGTGVPTPAPEIHARELAEVGTLIAPHVAAGIGPVEGVRALVAELATLRPLAGEVERLRPLAALGETYRTDLVEAALTEGVRAHGADFQRDVYAGVLSGSPIETIKRFRDDWARSAAKLFPGGRATTEPPIHGEGPAGPRLVPDAAYSA